MVKREEIQKQWENIVDLGLSDYKKLNRTQRIWFNIEPIINSGLIDHYVNFGANNNQDLIDDIKYIELDEIAELFKEVNNLFKEDKVPKDIEKRNNEIVNWNDNKKSILDKNENLFWSKSNTLEKKLLEFINKNLKSINNY